MALQLCAVSSAWGACASCKLSHSRPTCLSHSMHYEECRCAKLLDFCTDCRTCAEDADEWNNAEPIQLQVQDLLIARCIDCKTINSAQTIRSTDMYTYVSHRFFAVMKRWHGHEFEHWTYVHSFALGPKAWGQKITARFPSLVESPEAISWQGTSSGEYCQHP